MVRALRRHNRVISLARMVLLVGVCGLASGCIDDGPAAGDNDWPVHQVVTASADQSGSEENLPDGAVAIAVCGALRDQANAMAAVANDTVLTINAQTPHERFDTLADGFDVAARQVEAFRGTLDELDVPAVPERQRLLDEIDRGIDVALAELVDEQARFVDEIDQVTDVDVQGRVGQFFNSIEKVDSLMEPVISRYHRVDLQRAFLNEPLCTYVIQPFTIDGTVPTSGTDVR